MIAYLNFILWGINSVKLKLNKKIDLIFPKPIRY